MALSRQLFHETVPLKGKEKFLKFLNRPFKSEDITNRGSRCKTGFFGGAIKMDSVVKFSAVPTQVQYT
jgi:hypothetical protein